MQNLVIVNAGIFILMFFQQGWPLLIMGPGSIFEPANPLLVGFGTGLSLPFLLYGMWRLIRTGMFTSTRILRAGRTDPALKAELKRYRKGMFLFTLLGMGLALGLYLQRYPPPEFYGWAFFFAVALGLLGGMNLGGLLYLNTKRGQERGTHEI